MTRRFEGRVAVVTGGASGIGRAIAERIVAEGGQVVLADLDEARLAEAAAALGDAAATATVDVRREEDVAAMVATAVERFGRLDHGVNCAGVGTLAPITEHSLEEWSRVVDICLTGVFLSVKHEARRLVEQGEGGVILNIASINARQPSAGMAAYCAAKAGVEMLTTNAAMELAPRGVRVVGIGPGLVDTPMTWFAREVDDVREAYLDNIPLGRIGRTDDIANAAAFLLSDDASWITGTTLFVDGAELTKRYPDLLALTAHLRG